MTLSPDDIVNYPLKQAVRGYSVKQVDELLDQVADTLEETEGRIADLAERLEISEQRLASASETEATLKRTLVTAQRAAEQSLEEAKQRAAEIVDDARREAAAIVEQAKLEAEELRLESVQAARAEEAEIRRRRQAIEAHIEALRMFERDYRSRLRSHLDEQLRLLDEIPTRPPNLPTGVETGDHIEPDETSEQEMPVDPSNLGDSAPPEGPQLTVRVREDAESAGEHDDSLATPEAEVGNTDDPGTDVRSTPETTPDHISEERLWGDDPHERPDQTDDPA